MCRKCLFGFFGNRCSSHPHPLFIGPSCGPQLLLPAPAISGFPDWWCNTPQQFPSVRLLFGYEQKANTKKTALRPFWARTTVPPPHLGVKLTTVAHSDPYGDARMRAYICTFTYIHSYIHAYINTYHIT